MYPSDHSNIIYNSQYMEAPKYPSTYEWIEKLWCIYIYIYIYIYIHTQKVIKEKGHLVCNHDLIVCFTEMIN